MVHEVVPNDHEVPQDLKAFFGHPLNSSFDKTDGALALLHEYECLPAIERNGGSTDDSNQTSRSNSEGYTTTLHHPTPLPPSTPPPPSTLPLPSTPHPSTPPAIISTGFSCI